MKRFFLIYCVIVFLSSCGGNNGNNADNDGSGNGKNITTKANPQQVNISILLDLSDRINPQKYPSIPEHYERDIENIRTITEVFKSNMETLGAWKAKGKIRVFFSPPPDNPEINNIVNELNIDCSKMNNKEKKQIYDNLTDLFVNNIQKIYNETIQTSIWDGSDIWRFFKDDVKDYCIDSSPEYRNILIVFSDGYLYHKQSVYNENNRYSYLLNNNINKYRTSNWKQAIQNDDFGIISERSDLNNLEVLVLEISAENSNNKIDEDILAYLWKNWMTDMNVSHFEVYRSDLSSHTKTRIGSFLN